MGNVQLMTSHEYKCCLPEIIEDVETESDNEHSRQIVNQIPVIEKEQTEESFATTIPVHNR